MHCSANQRIFSHQPSFVDHDSFFASHNPSTPLSIPSSPSPSLLSALPHRLRSSNPAVNAQPPSAPFFLSPTFVAGRSVTRSFLLLLLLLLLALAPVLLLLLHLFLPPPSARLYPSLPPSLLSPSVLASTEMAASPRSASALSASSSSSQSVDSNQLSLTERSRMDVDSSEDFILSHPDTPLTPAPASASVPSLSSVLTSQSGSASAEIAAPFLVAPVPHSLSTSSGVASSQQPLVEDSQMLVDSQPSLSSVFAVGRSVVPPAFAAPIPLPPPLLPLPLLPLPFAFPLPLPLPPPPLSVSASASIAAPPLSVTALREPSSSLILSSQQPLIESSQMVVDSPENLSSLDQNAPLTPAPASVPCLGSVFTSQSSSASAGLAGPLDSETA